MKFWKKNELFKLVGIIIIIGVLLTWITPSASFAEGALSSSDFSRIGIFDIATFGLLGFNYFPFIFIFLFIVAGFYKFLENTDAYQALTDGIAKKVNGKVLLFAMISMVLYGVLSSIVTDYIVLFLFIPFTIAICAKLRTTKLTAFVSTFGGILLGVLGSTYSDAVAKSLTSVMTYTNYNPELVATIVIFIIGGVLLGYLTYEDTKKNGSNEEKMVTNFLANKVEEVVEEEPIKKSTKKGAAKKTATKVVKKAKTRPLIIVLVLLAIITILSYINWTEFGVSFFTDLHTDITEATIAGVTVVSYILGSSAPAFGSWTLFSVSAMVFIAIIILQIIYRVKFEDLVDSMLEGFGKISKTVLLVFMIYIVLEISYFFPTIATITNAVNDVFGDNIGTWLFASGFSSIFSVEFQYTVNELSGLLTYVGTDTPEIVALATQLAYGLVSFIAPTSIVLASGLTILGINFKDYFKFIWKFLVAMLVVIVLVLVILLLI